jgi:transcriptional regulator with XRE-family HTH domain
MSEVEYAKVLLGKLIKHTRATQMDQHELALRTGTSKNTISRLELGQGVNVDTLLAVLDHLELLAPFVANVEEQYALVKNNPQRSSSKVEKELPNDF